MCCCCNNSWVRIKKDFSSVPFLFFQFFLSAAAASFFCSMLFLVVASFVTVFIINGEKCGNEDVSDDVLMGCIVYEKQLYMRKMPYTLRDREREKNE